MKKLFIIIAIPIITFAQDIELSLEEAILKGLEKNKILQSSIKKIEGSQAKKSEQFALHFPTLKLQYGYFYQSKVPEFVLDIPPLGIKQTLAPNIQNIYSTKLTLQQPIFTGWKLQNLDDIADNQLQISKMEFDKDKSEIIFNITNAYWNLYKAIEYEKIINENLNLAKVNGLDIKQFYEKGLTTENEVLKINIKITNLEISLNEAANTIELARLNLNNLIGEKKNYKLSSTPDLENENILNLISYIEKAKSNRQELMIADKKIRNAEKSKSIVQSNWYPQIYLQSNYYYSKPNQKYFPLKNEFKDSWDIGITLQFDIWNNLTTYYQSENTNAQISQAKLGMEILEDQIILEVTQNYYAAIRSSEKSLLSAKSLNQASENLRIIRNKNEKNLSTNAELIEAENLLLQSKNQYLNSQIEKNLAIAKLNKSVGSK